MSAHYTAARIRHSPTSHQTIRFETNLRPILSLMSDNIEEFRHVLQSSKKILVLSGAGLSAAASGIPTYRGGTGSLWRKYDAASLATPAAFFQRTSLVYGSSIITGGTQGYFQPGALRAYSLGDSQYSPKDRTAL
ncbi:hypothetical protein BDN71DRAFT_1514718 [Pleurotus eryngii]|uniref:Deacetylase sirtuin-type domain-containing protein n=1 Tax=Pleurotus eryngii TaxID=5323 RepID=A0A9P5ZHV9_PLEER|nr:hypothetical protein BDN71DRAFT_1514718 [Pleurotus eryngii]